MFKYEFTGAMRAHNGVAVQQIRALRPLELSGVAPGDLGGWISGPHNLSHDGDCWVYPDAVIAGEAEVSGDCRIEGHAVVDGAARLEGFILLRDAAHVTDTVELTGSTAIGGTTTLYGAARIHCGEDGPQILSGIVIDFDVAYDRDYAVFGLSSDSGLIAAVNQAGRICIAETYDYPRFAGDRAAFGAWAERYLAATPAVARLCRAIDCWLAG